MGVMVTYRQYVLYICTLRTYVNSRTVVSACVRAKVMVPVDYLLPYSSWDYIIPFSLATYIHSSRVLGFMALPKLGRDVAGDSEVSRQLYC